MRIPFLQRESASERQSRIAAEEAQRAAKAKAWNQFWFHVKLVIGGVFILFVSLIGLLVFSVRNIPPSSHFTSSPIRESVSPIPREIPIQQSKIKNQASSSKGYVESEAEKEYERKNGVEIVHKKDGTTYERKALKKRK